MAILPFRPGIEISIVCNGAVLREYDDDDDDEDLPAAVISKYVEAVSGAEFGIQWKISPPWPPYTVLFECWLDQKKASGKFCKPAFFKYPSYIYTEEGATTVLNGQSYLHRFAFAALEVGKQTVPWR